MVSSFLMILTGACHAPALYRQGELLHVELSELLALEKRIYKYLDHERARKRAYEMGGYAQIRADAAENL